jgi:hypothetical protein
MRPVIGASCATVCVAASAAATGAAAAGATETTAGAVAAGAGAAWWDGAVTDDTDAALFGTSNEWDMSGSACCAAALCGEEAGVAEPISPLTLEREDFGTGEPTRSAGGRPPRELGAACGRLGEADSAAAGAGFRVAADLP